MVAFNYAAREVIAKIVYYGPGLCGKTTNLEELHKKMAPDKRGKMVSLATDTDRTLFFDLLPVDLGTIGGYRTKMQLFTVPGQTYYNNTRKLVLKGADGVVFVADSQATQMAANVESYNNLAENLKANGLDITTIPLVIQWNKQDMANLAPLDELEQKVNVRKVPTIKSVAVKGDGVLETFKLISKEVMTALSAKIGQGVAPAAKEKKIERADSAPLKVTTEKTFAPSAVGQDRVAAELSLEKHGVEGAKRTVEELGKLSAESLGGGTEAVELVNDIRKNVAAIIDDHKKIELRYDTMLRQLTKLAKVLSEKK
ncbi:MAG: hypothetical protein HZA04_03875 [Nitrospinae bacterium]|nr:hypothetical protein [Nitrospinota bacterium]